MTPSSFQAGNYFSIFSAALLKDTGFYADVNENLVTPLFWGKGKGCDFVNNKCKSKINKYREFS